MVRDDPPPIGGDLRSWGGGTPQRLGEARARQRRWLVQRAPGGRHVLGAWEEQEGAVWLELVTLRSLGTAY